MWESGKRIGLRLGVLLCVGGIMLMAGKKAALAKQNSQLEETAEVSNEQFNSGNVYQSGTDSNCPVSVYYETAGEENTEPERTDGILWNYNMAEFKVETSETEYEYLYFEYFWKDASNRERNARIFLADWSKVTEWKPEILEAKVPVMLAGNSVISCRLVLVRADGEEGTVEDYVNFPGTVDEHGTVYTLGAGNGENGLLGLPGFYGQKYIVNDSFMDAQAGDFILRIPVTGETSYRAWIKPTGSTEAYSEITSLKATHDDEEDILQLRKEGTREDLCYDVLVEVTLAENETRYLLMVSRPVQEAVNCFQAVCISEESKYVIEADLTKLTDWEDALKVRAEINGENTYTHQSYSRVCESDLASFRNQEGRMAIGWPVVSGVLSKINVYLQCSYQTPDPLDDESLQDTILTMPYYFEKQAEGQQAGIFALNCEVMEGNYSNVLTVNRDDYPSYEAVTEVQLMLNYFREDQWHTLSCFHAVGQQAVDFLKQEQLPCPVTAEIAGDAEFYLSLMVKKAGDEQSYTAVSPIETLAAVKGNEDGYANFTWEEVDALRPSLIVLGVNNDECGFYLPVKEGVVWKNPILAHTSDKAYTGNPVLNENSSFYRMIVRDIHEGGNCILPPLSSKTVYDYCFTMEKEGNSFAYFIHDIGAVGMLETTDAVTVKAVNKNELEIDFSQFDFGTEENPNYSMLYMTVESVNTSDSTIAAQYRVYAEKELRDSLSEEKVFTLTKLTEKESGKETKLYYDTPYAVKIYALGKGKREDGSEYTAGYPVRSYPIRTAPERIAQSIVPLTEQGILNKAVGNADFSINDFYVRTEGDGVLTYSCDTEDVIKVSSEGMVKVIGEGTARLTVHAGESADYLETDLILTVNIGPAVPISGITVRTSDNETSYTVASGTLQLATEVLPENTTYDDRSVLWESSDTGLATVDENGLVTFHGAGKVTISAVSRAINTVKGEVELTLTDVPVFTGTQSYQKYVGNDNFTLDTSLSKGDGVLSYQSDHPDVAAVDEKGVVTIVSPGNAEITVSCEKTELYAAGSSKVMIEVGAGVPITGLTLEGVQKVVRIGGSFTVSAQIAPENTTYSKKVTYQSSNEAVASVDLNGKVIGKSVGTVTIQAVSTVDNTIKSSFVLEVLENSKPFTSVTIAEELLLPQLNEEKVIGVSTQGSENNTDRVIWSSSNQAVAVVDAFGKIKAVGYGSATITAKSSLDANVKDTCIVLITNPSDVGSFVDRMYVYVLGREAEPTGREYWVNGLKAGTMTGAQIAVCFVMSDEFVSRNYSDDRFLNILYLSFFGRTPDPSGYQHWIGLLRNGISRKHVLSQFVKVKEYENLCGTYGIKMGEYQSDEARDRNFMLTAYLCRCYTQALARGYDVGGLNYWSEEILSQRVSARDAAITFIRSGEFVSKNLSDSDYVKVLYMTFFGRAYDQSGYEYWMQQLQTGAGNRESLLQYFANSKEFQMILNVYGVQ